MAEPTAQDQYMLELINRSRLDPDAEAARYGIDLNEGLSAGTISNNPKQPLAFNLDLFEAAEGHSQYMLDNNIFSHTGEGGSNSSERMQNAGYTFTNPSGSGENIAFVGMTGTPNFTSFVKQNHANLFIDENIPGRGHRVNLMNASFREIGISSLQGQFTSSRGTFNAVMSTQNFAYSAASGPFLTGVAYTDAVTDDDFYTVGEGLGGITVTAVDTTNSSNTFTTTTLPAGGYQIDLLPNRTYEVTFTGDLDGDGQGNDSAIYTVTIAFENIKLDVVSDDLPHMGDLPHISAISDLNFDEDTSSGPIAFTVSDADTSADSLTVTATSDNQTLIRDGNIALGGSGENRTIELTPASNEFGTANITVTVDDGTDSTIETFQVTVNSVNDLATVSEILDQDFDEDTSSGQISFTVSDVETSADSLTVTATSDNQTLIRDSDIALGGSGENRTIELTPAANEFGTANITVTVDDGTDSTIETFEVTVNPTDSSNAIAEYGTITNLTHIKQTINLQGNYKNPVVFVQPPSYRGSDPAIVRLDDITSNSFTAFIQEPNYRDGDHLAETASYFVIEAGIWQLSDGTVLEVGKLESEQLISTTWENVEFSADFPATPTILSNVQTYRGEDFVKTRQRDASATGFSLGMEEEEARQNSGHVGETIGWFAIESGAGIWEGNLYEAGNTGDRINHEFAKIEFTSEFASTPNFLATLATYDGTDPASLRYRNLTEDSVRIKIEEERSADSEIWHTTEDINFFAIEGEGILSAEPVILQPRAIAEYGTITDLTHEEKTIELQGSYENPVVIVQSLSFEGPNAAIARLTEVTSESFTLFVQEPEYLDGTHFGETVSYFVIEAGTWQLSDGTLIEAGTFNENLLVTQGWETVELNDGFEETPITLSQVQSFNGSDFIKTRQRNATAESFQVAMEKEDALRNSTHAEETVGWLAIEAGDGMWGENTWLAGNTGDRLDHNWHSQSFDGLFEQPPHVLAGIASYDGSDGVALRYRNLDASGVEFKLQEETSADSEIWHTTETVNFLALGGNRSD